MNEIKSALDSNGIATITLNRPDRHNAFNDAMILDLRSVLGDLDMDPKVRVVKITAVGKSFSAGADLEWMKRMAEFSEEENYQDALAMAGCFHALATLAKPTIAVVQGPAFGGGVGLVAACDIAVAASKATFCFPEVRLGLIPAVISPYINQAMGIRAARRFFLTGEPFSAEDAERLGLIHKVVAAAHLTGEADRLCRTLLQNGPLAMAAVKERLTPYVEPSSRLPPADTARWIAAIRSSAEGQEGITAFLTKRSPKWVNGN